MRPKNRSTLTFGNWPVVFQPCLTETSTGVMLGIFREEYIFTIIHGEFVVHCNEQIASTSALESDVVVNKEQNKCEKAPHLLLGCFRLFPNRIL